MAEQKRVAVESGAASAAPPSFPGMLMLAVALAALLSGRGAYYAGKMVACDLTGGTTDLTTGECRR